MKITPKIEDYLETIYRLSEEMDTVGVSDVAKARQVSVPTARTAVSKLQEIGYVHQKHYGKIILHETGRVKAKEIFRIHKTLRRFLSDFLLVKPELAEHEACLMEHGLGLDTLERLQHFLDALDENPDLREKIMSVYKDSMPASATGIDNNGGNEEMTLLDLGPGNRGVITRIYGNGRLRHRMLDMGLHIGQEITMVKTAPFRDPVEFAMNGNHISLRREEAKLVCIEETMADNEAEKD